MTVDLRGKKHWVFFFFFFKDCLDDKQIVVWLKDLYCKAVVDPFVENIWEVRKEGSKLGINLFFQDFLAQNYYRCIFFQVG